MQQGPTTDEGRRGVSRDDLEGAVERYGADCGARGDEGRGVCRETLACSLA